MGDSLMAPVAPTLTDADYARLADFRHALRRFSTFSRAAARAAGLTSQQHQALLAIRGHREGLTIGGLADQLLVAPHTAAGLVARLQAGGLVARTRDADDRRRVGLTLTARAETALRRLSLVHLREVRDLAPRLVTLLADLDPAR